MQENEILHFDKMAHDKGYAWWGSRTYSGKLRKLVRAKSAKKYLGDLSGLTILEIGCASGDYTAALAKEFPDSKIIATDISPGQIGIARNNVKEKNVDFQVDDCEKMNIETGSIDCVIANSILHHVNYNVCLREIFRVLKSGGRIFITEPNMINPQVFIEKNIPVIKKIAGHSPDEIAFYRKDMQKEVIKSGFKSATVKNFDFLHPATPKCLSLLVNNISRVLEKIPGVKEFSGSLIIYGEKI